MAKKHFCGFGIKYENGISEKHYKMKELLKISKEEQNNLKILGLASLAISGLLCQTSKSKVVNNIGLGIFGLSGLGLVSCLTSCNEPHDKKINVIRIFYSYNYQNKNWETINYFPNMTTQIKSPFLNQIIDSLNIIYNTENGKIVLDKIMNLKGFYLDISNTLPTTKVSQLDKKLSFLPKGSTGIINAKDITQIDNYTKINSFAHELYHAYQYINGSLNELVVSCEIEACLFATIVLYKKFKIINTLGRNDTVEGTKYQSAIDDLLTNGYSTESFQNTITNFMKGSILNINGKYEKIGYKVDTIPLQFKPTISELDLIIYE